MKGIFIIIQRIEMAYTLASVSLKYAIISDADTENCFFASLFNG
jgi:hypothetical protein